MIEDKVAELISGERDDFDRLALEVFEHQYSRVRVYRRLCDGRGKTPDTVESWQDIPPLPSDAFKGDLEIERTSETTRVFLSSGTTSGGQRPSRVELASPELYRLAALGWFDTMVMPDAPGPMAVLRLGPGATTHPHSSLGEMFSWIESAHGDGQEQPLFFDPGGTLDLDGAIEWLEQRAALGRPVLILALSSALTALLSRLRERTQSLRLPADSRLVDTGGRKGGAAVLSAKGMLKAVWKQLHIPAYLSTNEYGMTEMASQFYDDAWRSRCSGQFKPRAKTGPPWTRTRVVNPASLETLPEGQDGLLLHFDLANLETVSSLLTLDLGRACGGGFELGGRADGAEARGCSALLEDIER